MIPGTSANQAKKVCSLFLSIMCVLATPDAMCCWQAEQYGEPGYTGSATGSDISRTGERMLSLPGACCRWLGTCSERMSEVQTT